MRLSMDAVAASVVVPARNAAATIGDQLEALARQKVRGDWEIVVVDDGSTDGTRQVIDGFTGRLPIVVVPLPKGPSSAGRARNAGVEAARGEVILFCDADDIVDDGWFEAMQDALDDHDFVAARWDEQKLNDADAFAAAGRSSRA